ncbi:sugar phosphate isomerase/epimerase [bacterium]|nr:sugar phosphate isomerase/epimerase [bacterium]
MEIGISTGLFYHKDIFPCLDKFARAGFKNIELWAGSGDWGKNTHFDYNNEDVLIKIKSAVSLRKINICSINAPFSENLDISSVDEIQRSIAVSEIKKAVVLCEFFKADHLIIHPAVKALPLTDKNFVEKKIKQIKKSLADILENAMLHRVKIACENPSPHLLGGWAQDLMEIIKDFPKEHMGICLDTGHANLIEKPDEYLGKIEKRLMTLHVSDNSGDYSSHLPPGAGNIDWDKFSRALFSHSFDGVFMMEILGSARFADPDEVLAKAFKRASEIVKMR